MEPIRVAIVGIGNCASALVQGIYYYRHHHDAVGLMRPNIGGYGPGDMEIVVAFDADPRKVGLDVSEAIFAEPNCAQVFYGDLPKTGVVVQRGPLMDGLSSHMMDDDSLIAGSNEPADSGPMALALRDSGAEVLVNYLPVGSEDATRFYADCAIKAGCGMVNCIPVFIASDPKWADRFAKAKLPIIGDDIKSQFGATITHRVLVDLCRQCGIDIDQTYQLNFGGNTDFKNMLSCDRLGSKKVSKTEAVQAVAGKRLDKDKIHIGPSDYVPFLNDNKVCYVRIEGRGFGGTKMDLEMRLSVQDSPNSAGVVVDAVRCCKLAMVRKVGGPLESPSACLCKHPPKQFTDQQAWQVIEEFISDNS